LIHSFYKVGLFFWARLSFYAVLLYSFVGIRSYSYFDGGVGGDDDFYLGFFESKTNLKVKIRTQK